eukprot:COSAG06_NODE_2719_length_6389_cov_4.265978_1_plen_47_part_00
MHRRIEFQLSTAYVGPRPPPFAEVGSPGANVGRCNGAGSDGAGVRR